MDLNVFRSSVRCLALFALLTAARAATDGHHLVKTISIPGDYGWDYLTADSEGRRPYVSHDKEVVIDLDSGTIRGKIPGSDVHGIAIIQELGRGFVSATDPGSVAVFDLKTLAVVAKVTVGEDPNAIFYDRVTKRVFTIDRGSKRVTALDPKTNKIAGTVEGLGGKTEHAVSDDAGHVFVNMQDLGTLLRIDAESLKITDTWTMAPCGQPSSMDIDRPHQRIFIGCRTTSDAGRHRMQDDRLQKRAHDGREQPHGQNRRHTTDRQRCGRDRVRPRHRVGVSRWSYMRWETSR
jgi:hypothetical protein